MWRDGISLPVQSSCCKFGGGNGDDEMAMFEEGLPTEDTQCRDKFGNTFQIKSQQTKST